MKRAVGGKDVLLGLGTVLVVAGAAWVGMGVGVRTPALAEAVALDPLPAKATFNKYIRPIMSDRCFACHGPDNNKRQAGLRLDLRAGAFDPLPGVGGAGGQKRAFVPGKPELSNAYQRIMSEDPGQVMPPPKAHTTLTAYQKALFRKWIEQGAVWEEHWAFVKPVRPELPAVKDAAWGRNEIDRFILGRLEQEGMHPSAEADKATLARRVALDLTGLPPTPAELDAYMADTSSDAYERMVDRLLASPHYGEQMAVQWLDDARYADSHGFQSDPERFMWRWRDWVINAYNANMPFDQFTIEQLAGDLLPNATIDQKIATGFNRNARINSEGGSIAEEWRVEGVVDRVETTSAVFLGLTMGCCRCHDHKFDPITQKEFYRFSAFFNSVNEVGMGDGYTDKGHNVPPILNLPSPEQQAKLSELGVKTAAAEAKIKELTPQLPALQAAWEKAGANIAEPAGLMAKFPLDGKAEGVDGGGKVVAAAYQGVNKKADDSSEWLDGKGGKALHLDGKGGAVEAGQAVQFERTDAFSYGCWVMIQGGGAILSKMDEGPAFRGFDLYVEGDKLVAHLLHAWPDNGIRVMTKAAVPMKTWIHVMVTYDGSSKAGGVKIFVDGKAQGVNATNDTLKESIASKSPVLIGRRPGAAMFSGDVRDVQFYNRTLRAQDVMSLAQRPAVFPILQIAAEKRTAEQKAAVAKFYAAYNPDLVAATADQEEAKRQTDELNMAIPNTMVMEDLPKPRDTFVLIRGQYDKHGEKVDPGVPGILPPLPKDAPLNRLTLAKWVVDPANPLTARVQANRLWEKFFGMGLVKITENFGTQTEWPSHPELLDWLATEMIAKKWDLKAFQKMIVMSATYRQQSILTPEMIERDPENRLLAHGPRVRMGAELVRDQALAASGLLAEKLGGPSVKPYEPPAIWDGNRFGNLAKYEQDKGEGLYRRSLYTFWKRTAAPPNLMLFDMPSREFCVVKRSRTDTPLQALDLMNDTTYLEASRVLGQRMMTEGGATPEQRIAFGFKCLICRTPSESESKILLAGLEKQLEKFRSDKDAATKFLSAGEAKRDDKLDVSELAAYAMTASVILNLDEAVTKP